MIPATLAALERLCQQPPEETITAEHLERCGYCLLCIAVLEPSGEPPWEPASPTYALRYLAHVWPEIEWLVFLPRDERLWYSSHADALMRRFPSVPGEAWAKLFR